MAISTPTSLGTNSGDSAGGSTTVTLTTSGTVPANGLIIVGAGGWTSAGAPTLVLTGGGLTWTQDRYLGSGSFSLALFSAPAVSGLASGTVLTATWGSTTNGRPIGGFYVTDADLSATRQDGSSSASGSGTAGSAGTMTTTVVGDIAIGLMLGDSPITTSTAGANYTELWDFQGPINNQTFTAIYRLSAPVGSNNPTNTWATSVGTSLGVASAYEPGVPVDLQDVLPDADTATTGWTTAPLFSKVNDASDATVITSTLA